MITINSLTKTYGKGEAAVNALKDVTLTINDGELAAVSGKSGSGKTTLLNLIGGLDSPTSGEVRYNDRNISQMNDTELSDFRLKNIGFVFQFYDLIPELTAEENILLPTRLAKNGNEKKLPELAERLGISDRLKHYPSQLSGGQQQRAAIARALINEPDVILCDEPTGNLDEKSGNEVMKLLCELHKTEKKTVIIVTHNPEIAKICEREIVISDGVIAKMQED